ncbi:hypothetical protein D3C80_1876540 [compost metagenome]
MRRRWRCYIYGIYAGICDKLGCAGIPARYAVPPGIVCCELPVTAHDGGKL